MVGQSGKAQTPPSSLLTHSIWLATPTYPTAWQGMRAEVVPFNPCGEEQSMQEQ